MLNDDIDGDIGDWPEGDMGVTAAVLQREMPKYRCHKEVWALKIAVIKIDGKDDPNSETDGSATITPVEEGYGPFKVDSAYMRKHKSQVGGYYVQYKDGYTSFSPADAFEDGYTRI